MVETHQMQAKDLPNLPTTNNPKDPVIQPKHVSEYHEKILIWKRLEWASNQQGVEENLQDGQF